MKEIGLGDTVYFARVIQSTGTCELLELKVRTVYPECFVGVNKETAQAYIISYEECDVHIFDNRETALAIVKEAEKHRKKFTKMEEGD